jgi:hypothetical protein
MREKISFLETWPMMRKTGEPSRSRMMVVGTTSPSWKLWRVAGVAPVKTGSDFLFFEETQNFGLGFCVVEGDSQENYVLGRELLGELGKHGHFIAEGGVGVFPCIRRSWNKP